MIKKELRKAIYIYIYWYTGSFSRIDTMDQVAPGLRNKKHLFRGGGVLFQGIDKLTNYSFCYETLICNKSEQVYFYICLLTCFCFNTLLFFLILLLLSVIDACLYSLFAQQKVKTKTNRIHYKTNVLTIYCTTKRWYWHPHIWTTFIYFFIIVKRWVTIICWVSVFKFPMKAIKPNPQKRDDYLIIPIQT